MQLISAVGNNGSVYILQKTNGYDPAGFATYLAQSMMDRFGTLDISDIANNYSATEYIEFCENMWKDAELYGLKYYKS